MTDRVLRLNGRRYDLVVTRRTGVSVYRGEGVYLRLGHALTPELAVHRQMLHGGFPVADILEVGEHEGEPYLIEKSLGPSTLGDLYAEQVEVRGYVDDQAFAPFLQAMRRHARAQLAGERRRFDAVVLAEFLGVGRAAENVSAQAPRITSAFRRAEKSLRRWPLTLQHADLHPYNTCRGGVIDLEGAGWAVAGYDVLTAVLDPTLAAETFEQGRLRISWFTTRQIRTYLSAVEAEFAHASIASPIPAMDALLLCRTIAICSHRHPHPEVRRKRRGLLAGVLDSYLGDGHVPLVDPGSDPVGWLDVPDRRRGLHH